MKQHDPKHASDDPFDDEPTGQWRVIDAAQAPLPESEDEELDPDQLVELAG
jgi:hypothetical protein